MPVGFFTTNFAAVAESAQFTGDSEVAICCRRCACDLLCLQRGLSEEIELPNLLWAMTQAATIASGVAVAKSHSAAWEVQG